MGFRNMEDFNEAMLAMLFWHLFKGGNSLVACLLKSKYFPNDDIINIVAWSFIWHNILGVQDIIV